MSIPFVTLPDVANAPSEDIPKRVSEAMAQVSVALNRISGQREVWGRIDFDLNGVMQLSGLTQEFSAEVRETGTVRIGLIPAFSAIPTCALATARRHSVSVVAEALEKAYVDFSIETSGSPANEAFSFYIRGLRGIG